MTSIISCGAKNPKKESKQASKGNKKPAITINLKKGEKCTIIGMKLSHSGNTEDV